MYAENYLEAIEINRASCTDQVGLSKQSFHLCPKIQEVDQFVRQTQFQADIFETHPELSFWEMNQCRALQSKHSNVGSKERKMLLQEAGLLPDINLTKDDLDALACLWSAIRIQKKESRCVPCDPPLDRFKLPMRIMW